MRRHALGHAHARPLQRLNLFGIVRHQPHRRQSEVTQNRARRAHSRADPPQNRVARLASTVSAPWSCKLVGAQLVQQADAAALLIFVNQQAAALARRSSRSASSSCARQSQRRLWNTSPVRHCEWMRTSGGLAREIAHLQHHGFFEDAAGASPANP